MCPTSSERELRFFRYPFLVKRNGRKPNCLSLEGEFWVCSEANYRMVEKIFLSCDERVGHHARDLNGATL